MEAVVDQQIPSKLRFNRVLCLLGLTTVLSGCGDSAKVEEDHEATIIREEQSQRYVTPEEGGYPHYKDVYRFVVQQCGREDLSMANEDGCVNFTITVSKREFDEYGPGDQITFQTPRSGYPSNPDK